MKMLSPKTQIEADKNCNTTFQIEIFYKIFQNHKFKNYEQKDKKQEENATTVEQILQRK